jgi:hypothetical protein
MGRANWEDNFGQSVHSFCLHQHFAHADTSGHEEHRQQVQSSHVVISRTPTTGNTAINPTPNAPWEQKCDEQTVLQRGDRQQREPSIFLDCAPARAPQLFTKMRGATR